MSTRPPLVGSDGPHQVYLSEGGPVDVHEDELAVSPLPEEEVAQPLLPRGAYYQVRLGVREVRGIEPSRDRLLRDLARAVPVVCRPPPVPIEYDSDMSRCLRPANLCPQPSLVCLVNAYRPQHRLKHRSTPSSGSSALAWHKPCSLLRR